MAMQFIHIVQTSQLHQKINNTTFEKSVVTIKINRMRFLVLFITILLCSNTIKAQRLYSESGDFYEKSTNFSYVKFSFTYRSVLLSIDSFHQFIWRKYLHLGETKPLFAQVLYGCSYVIHIIVYTKEAVM